MVAHNDESYQQNYQITIRLTVTTRALRNAATELAEALKCLPGAVVKKFKTNCPCLLIQATFLGSASWRQSSIKLIVGVRSGLHSIICSSAAFRYSSA